MDKLEYQTVKRLLITIMILGIMASLIMQVIIFGIYISFKECLCKIGCDAYQENYTIDLTTRKSNNVYFEVKENV